ncbi:MAG: gliding motility-associated C-terminal domain-containing protein [Saprospirales bacterium]|nr:gliding motility-associated C-terminal domain-containing protein [Saprospirales bacterium]
MKHFFLLVLLLLGGYSLQATHIVGGEITYTCLGNNRFEIRLTVYRDCYNGVPWFDNPAYIGFYDANWNLVSNIPVNWDAMTHDTLPIILENPCLVAPPNVCVHRSTYVTEVNLSFRPGGYSIVYQRCCRNKLIRNLPDPLNTGISIVANLSEKTMLECNNSAVFNKWPPVAICVHEPINFDHSAADADGDSLVYRLCTPLNGPDSVMPQPVPPRKGPYPEIIWNDPPYNLSNVLGGQPLAINPNSGFITGIPNTIGNFVVGVCVDEYRNNDLISTTRRDFQYNVADCGVPTAAFFAPGGGCENEAIKFINQSNVPDSRWYFDWPDNLSLTTTERSPMFQFPDTGTYTVALITAPGLPCADTMFQLIHIGALHINAGMVYELPSCDNNGLLIQAFDKSMDSVYGVASWLWRLTGSSGFNVQSTLQNPSFLVKKPGSYKLTLVVMSAGGCRDTLVKQFNAPIPRVDSLIGELAICLGDSVRLNSGGIDGYLYSWAPPAGLSDSTAASPFAFPLETTDYLVTITNAGCTYEGMVTVSVFDTSALTLSAMPTTIYLGDSSQLEAYFPGNGMVNWSPFTSLIKANTLRPVAIPNTTTTYTASIQLNGGCVLERSVTITVLYPNCEEPFLFFPTGFSPNGDGENDLLRLESRFVEEIYWAVYNRWGQKIFETTDPDGAWDGTFKGEDQPVETYGYYMRVRCRGGSTAEKKGNVTLLR